MATCADVTITNIDSQGVPRIKLYADWSMERMCSALGVPEEMMGLGRGSTEATANVRLQAFYDKIGTLQKRFARQWNSQILDPWSKATGGKAGDAKLVFNDVSPIDEGMIADLVQKLTAASGSVDPFQIVTPEWCRKRLGISEEEFQKWRDEQDKIDEEQMKLYPPPPNPFQGGPKPGQEAAAEKKE